MFVQLYKSCTYTMLICILPPLNYRRANVIYVFDNVWMTIRKLRCMDIAKPAISYWLPEYSRFLLLIFQGFDKFRWPAVYWEKPSSWSSTNFFHSSFWICILFFKVLEENLYIAIIHQKFVNYTLIDRTNMTEIGPFNVCTYGWWINRVNTISSWYQLLEEERDMK